MSVRLAIVGATGLVGHELLRIMAKARFSPESLGLYASTRSAGVRVEWQGREQEVCALDDCDFSDYDAAFFCVGDPLSAEYVPQALDAGCAVVDKSNSYRLDPQVPLVVPGVNSDAVTGSTRLVANPNCTTIVLQHALQPLRRFGLQRMFVATYQSVSGAGAAGVTKLSAEIAERGMVSTHHANLRDGTTEQIASNVQPQIGQLDGQGRAGEEVKLIEESRKILALPDLPIVCHAVRVPVFVGHAIAVSVELGESVSADAIKAAWQESVDVKCMVEALPTPVSAAQHDCVEVGRHRPEPMLNNGWSFFVCGDNLNIGAALNGWRILKLMAQAGAVPALALKELDADG